MASRIGHQVKRPLDQIVHQENQPIDPRDIGEFRSAKARPSAIFFRQLPEQNGMTISITKITKVDPQQGVAKDSNISASFQKALIPNTTQLDTNRAQTKEDIDSMLKEGQRCYDEQQYPLAIDVFKKGLTKAESKPEHSNLDEKKALLCMRLGKAYLKNKQWVDAREILIRGLSFVNNEITIKACLYIYLGKAHFQSREFPLAITAYEKALLICGEGTFKSHFMAELAEAYRHTEQNDKALHIIQLALVDKNASWSSMMNLYCSLGWTWLSKDDLEQAATAFSNALAIEQCSSQSQTFIKSQLVEVRMKQAIGLLKSSLTHCHEISEVNSYCSLGLELLAKNDFEQAATAFSMALSVEECPPHSKAFIESYLAQVRLKQAFDLLTSSNHSSHDPSRVQQE